MAKAWFKLLSYILLPYFYEYKGLNTSTRKSLFVFRITQNYTFYCKYDKLKCVNHLTTVYLEENKTWT
jgi:hypothetical protein